MINYLVVFQHTHSLRVMNQTEIIEVFVEDILIDNVKYLIDDDGIVYKVDIDIDDNSMDFILDELETFVGIYNRMENKWILNIV